MSGLFPIPAGRILPQRAPFLFVDALTEYDPAFVRTRFTVTADVALVEDGHLTAAGLLENMAQASAARIGYIAKYILHIPIRIGYIGAIKGGRIYRLPRIGEVLETTVEFREEIFEIVLVDISVRIGDELIAEASFKTSLGEKEMEE